jgi:lysophospholipase L1-like esterase
MNYTYSLGRRAGRAALLAATVVLACVSARAQAPAVKSGDKIAFLGDSITQQGNESAAGYVRLVISGLEQNQIKATAIPAGIGGHKSDQMLERLERDVLSKKPDWMTLSCGVNDVWHGARGIPLPQYKINITEIVTRAQAAGVKVMLLTSTMIGEDQPNDNNQKLVAYNEFLRQLAKEKNCLLADLNADMQAALKAIGESRKGNQLTSDGVHMNPFGNIMMAAGVLKAFGLSDVQMQKARAHWMTIPVEVRPKVSLPLAKYQALSDLAAKRQRSVSDLVNDEVVKAVDALLQREGK